MEKKRRQNYVTLHCADQQLGGQLFLIAQTLTFAWDNHLLPTYDKNVFRSAFPPSGEICYQRIWNRLPTIPFEEMNQDPLGHYSHASGEPPVYSEGMGNVCFCGARSDRWHLAEWRKDVCSILGPTKEIIGEIRENFPSIVNHSKSVSVHVRAADPRNNYHMFLGKDYFVRAMNYFSDDYLFVIFSDRIEWCKKNLQGIKPNMVFVEGNDLCIDLYLMTLCKNSVLSNSTFSYMGAYLRGEDPGLVIAPYNWFYYGVCDPLVQPGNPSRSLYLPNWTIVDSDPYQEHNWDLLNYPTTSLRDV